MVTIIEQGGFQYKVSEGDKIQVPFIKAEEGEEITLDRVLLVSKDDDVTVGTPIVEGAEVKAKVIVHGKDKKILVMKKKRRKDYKVKNGHRQDFTQLQITSISV
jgi:large subunit ribosomal protein L21